MTPVEALAVVRARLEHMVELSQAATSGPWVGGAAGLIGGSAGVVVSQRRHGQGPYGSFVIADRDDEARVEDAVYVAAASPDLLLRVAREALGVLGRHQLKERSWNPVLWCGCCGVWVEWPCPEVTSVLRAWQP